MKDFTAADGHQYGLPRDLNTIALFYNKTMFDAAGIAYPDDTWDWAKLVEVAKQLTEAGGEPRTSGASTPRRPTWRTTGRRSSGRPAATSSAPTRQTVVIDSDRGRGRDPVPPGPHLQGQGHGPARARRHRRRLRERPGGHGGERLVARPDPRGGRARTSAWRPLPKGPAGQATSVNPSGVVVYKGTEVARRGLGVREVLHGPGDAGHDRGPEGVDAGQQGGPHRPVRDVVRRRQDLRRRARRTRISSRRSTATTSSRTALQDELDSKVFNDNQMTAKARARRGHAAARAAPRPVRPARHRARHGPPMSSSFASGTPRPGSAARPGPVAVARDERVPLGVAVPRPRPSSASRSCPPGRSSPRSGSA